jgi:hypothetical protein
MASGVFNAGAGKIADRTIDWVGSSAIKVMLLGNDTPYTFDKDHAVMTTPAASELTVTGYTGGHAGAGRKALASKTITIDNANDRVVFDAADPSAWTLSTGENVTGAIVFYELANDAASVPIFYLDFTDVPTNGSTFTLVFHADGISYQQQ